MKHDSGDNAKNIFNKLSDEDSLSEFIINNPSAENLYFEAKRIDEPYNIDSLDNKLSVVIGGFANASGGVLVLGVEEKDKIFSLRPFSGFNELSRKIKDRLYSYTQPNVMNVDVEVIRSENEYGYIKIFIPKSINPPHQSSKTKSYYSRYGSTFRELHHFEVENLFRLRMGPVLRVAVKLSFDPNSESSCRADLLLINEGNSIARYLLLIVEEFKNNWRIPEYSLTDLQMDKNEKSKRKYEGGGEIVIHVGGEKLIAKMSTMPIAYSSVDFKLSGRVACDGLHVRSFTIQVSPETCKNIIEQKTSKIIFEID